jgi:hypothetical protein
MGPSKALRLVRAICALSSISQPGFLRWQLVYGLAPRSLLNL